MSILGLSVIDWVILTVLATFALIGFYRGLIREVFTLVGVFLSLLFAFLLMSPAGRLIARWAPMSERIQLIIGFLAIFFLSLIILHVLFYFFSRIYRFTPIGLGDRIAGLAFGLLKGGFVVFIALFFIGLLPLTSHVSRFFRNSATMQITRSASPKIERIFSALPKLKDVVNRKKGKIIIEKAQIRSE
jgi:membrane protein required for colicin V production